MPCVDGSEIRQKKNAPLAIVQNVWGAGTNRLNPASTATPMNVSLVMRRKVASIKPEASLLEAAHLLLKTNQRGLPVIDGEGALVGIISEGDFLHRVSSI
jgi:CBS domain-containing protein